MKKIGLTGGIGSGKSVVRRIFEVLGIPTYDADFEAKQLINKNTSIISEIKMKFGDSIYTHEGLIDKKKLSEIIFSDKSKLETINNIVHPAVQFHFNLWLNEQKTAPYIIKEAAILFESGAYKNLDTIITVVSPLNLRIQRIIERDNCTEQAVIERIKSQFSDHKKIQLSDFVIKNEEQALLLPQILAIHKTLSGY